MHLVGFIIKIYHDTRSHERRIWTYLSYGDVDSSVDEVTIYVLDNRRNVFRFPARETFLFPTAFRQLWANSVGTRGVFPQRWDRGSSLTAHLSISNAEDTNEWNNNSSHSYVSSIGAQEYIYIYIYASSFVRDFKLYFSWSERPRSVQALRHKPGDSDFDSPRVPWKFSSDLFLLSASSSPTVHSTSNRNSLENKVWPELRAGNSAVLVGPDVQVRMEVEQSVVLHFSRVFVTCHGKAFLLPLFVLCFLAKASTTNNSLNMFSRIRKSFQDLIHTFARNIKQMWTEKYGRSEGSGGSAVSPHPSENNPRSDPVVLALCDQTPRSQGIATVRKNEEFWEFWDTA